MIASSEGIGYVAALGLALGASPFGIVGVILLLNTEHPLRNAISFTAGWIFAVIVVALVTAKLFPPPTTAPTSTASAVIAAEFVLGAALLIVGGIQWRRRSSGDPGAEPRWMQRMKSIGPVLSFAIGALLPTYALVFPAVQAIEGAGAPRGQMIAAFVIFLVMATLGLVIPIGVYTFRREQSEETLERWRLWLLGNQRAVGGLIMAALGVALLLRGVQGLAS